MRLGRLLDSLVRWDNLVVADFSHDRSRAELVEFAITSTRHFSQRRKWRRACGHSNE
jgi:hypothetical protein